jgi:hypothetical protein
MKKVLAPGVNCWAAFLACLTDLPLSETTKASTEHDDWKERTESLLATQNLYFAEVNPGLVSQLPHDSLVGAHLNGIERKHILVARVKRFGPRHGFEVYHDPAQKRAPGTMIKPERIVLLCRLEKV